MTRALGLPLLVLAFFLAAYTVLEANRYLASLLFQEAEVLAAYFRVRRDASLLGVRVTQQPESYLPLIPSCAT
ncbi:hypothetical protein [Thermus scotoductus]|uniref:Uncharacterized protein n=1 Tax=Thermus scotoductus TaxID=37636 RepID=A0A430S0K7_THESC|nr:hypothetical protein [Thermus scotoductus]RTG96933.1 hypothetical protein CSW51_04185 [Thermus scotoductus]RTH27039.1 hypothetical protein CSW38_04355 [Thermus scotoductus]